jgi:hypothetical protein
MESFWINGLSLLGVLVTAIATVALWRATNVLAVETRRMASATSQPQVIVSIEENRWSMTHADMRVANTGNATTFDIKIEFDPPLIVELENQNKTRPTPFRNLAY